jgi:hypothetical protein
MWYFFIFLFCFCIVYTGNENLHKLTKDGNYQLRVDLQDWNDTKKYALYNIFNVGDEATKYQLSVGGYSGDAGKYKCHSFIYEDKGVSRGRDRMVVEFTTTCAISAYYH